MELHQLLLDGDIEMPEGCGIGTHGESGGLTKGFDAPAITDDENVPSAGSDDDPIFDAEDEDEDESEGDGDTRVSDGDTDADEDDDGSDGGGDEGDDAEGDDGSGDAEGEDDGESDAEGAGDGGKGGEDEDGEDAEDGESGKGAGSGHVDAEADTDTEWDKTDNPFDDMLETLADQIKDDLAASSDNRTELDRLSKALDRISAMPERLRLGHKDMAPVDKDLAKVGYHLTQPLRLFTDAAGAYWEREVDSGRINIARYLRDERFDPETGYDRFEPGMLDDLSLEVVVLLG